MLVPFALDFCLGRSNLRFLGQENDRRSFSQGTQRRLVVDPELHIHRCNSKLLLHMGNRTRAATIDAALTCSRTIGREQADAHLQDRPAPQSEIEELGSFANWPTLQIDVHKTCRNGATFIPVLAERERPAACVSDSQATPPLEDDTKPRPKRRL